jgi:hypothetical protein
MFKYFFGNNENDMIFDSSSKKTYDSSTQSPKYKLSRDKSVEYNLNIIEEELLKSLDINYSLMENIYFIHNKVSETDKINVQVSKIIEIIEKKKNNIIKTTKNTCNLLHTSETLEFKIYVENFNKLLDVSFKLISGLNINQDNSISP